MKRVLSLLCISLAAGPARADPVDLQLRSSVLYGKEKPALILTVNQALADAKIDFVRSDGKKMVAHSGRLKVGAVHEFILDAPVGTHTFEGDLSVTFTDGSTSSMPLSLQVEVAAGFGIDVPEEKVDLEAGTAELTLTRAAGYCDHEVLVEDQPVRRGRTEFSGEPAGTGLTVSWRTFANDGMTLKITIDCHDADRVFETGIELYPWKLEIPHQEIEFDSGKWEIKPDELPKLTEAYTEIKKAIDRFGRWIKGVKLFVAGHTDTVGGNDYNRDLSLKRARAIAGHFRDRGVRIPIIYAGFGEDEPAVPTPDETAAQANRRADYVIRVTTPAGNWHRL